MSSSRSGVWLQSVSGFSLQLPHANVWPAGGCAGANGGRRPAQKWKPVRQQAQGGKEWLKLQAKALARRVVAGPVLARLAVIVLFLPAFLGLWTGVLVTRLLAALVESAAFPLHCLDRLAHWLRQGQGHPPLPELAHAAACDVWVLPFFAVPQRLDLPTVLFIHDLVWYHFPRGFRRTDRENWLRMVRQRAQEAILCACMSQFIRDTDLLGVLGLPADKVAMVRPAPPTDFPEISDEEALCLRPAEMTRPYLLFPAAYRDYKNHAGLIRALAVLRDDFREQSFDLAFTCDKNSSIPLKLLAEELEVEEHVHILGRVDRRTLAALYRQAYAVLMPSLYEQGSFPIYEALRWQCPVACSDIPSMREQCQSLGAAMLYFDPHDPQSIARSILTIRDDRDGWRRRQTEASQAAWNRTWTQVAREWLALFREAAKQGSGAFVRLTPDP